jgi:hypothetical protein
LPNTFVLDRAGGALILKAVTATAVLDLAKQVANSAGVGASVEGKVSQSRFVATVKVPAEEQAKNGVLSRAATDVGLTITPYKRDTTGRKRVIGFVSKRQWRWAFWSEKPWARDKARETPGEKLIRYRNLPEATGTKK